MGSEPFSSSVRLRRAKALVVGAVALFLLAVALTSTGCFPLSDSGLSSSPSHTHADAHDDSWLSKMALAALGPLAAIPDVDEETLESLENFENRHKDALETLQEEFGSQIGNETKHHPVLFIPGFMGSQLETKLSNRKKPHWWHPSWLFCPKTTKEYHQIWFIQHAQFIMLPFVIDCYAETMMQKWKFNTRNDTITDDQDKKVVPQRLPFKHGIDTRPTPSFEAVMQLDSQTPMYKYYALFLTGIFGYQPGQNMIGQPFDWRAGPETWMQPNHEFDQMKTSIGLTLLVVLCAIFTQTSPKYDN